MLALLRPVERTGQPSQRGSRTGRRRGRRPRSGAVQAHASSSCLPRLPWQAARAVCPVDGHCRDRRRAASQLRSAAACAASDQPAAAAQGLQCLPRSLPPGPPALPAPLLPRRADRSHQQGSAARLCAAERGGDRCRPEVVPGGPQGGLQGGRGARRSARAARQPEAGPQLSASCAQKQQALVGQMLIEGYGCKANPAEAREWTGAARPDAPSRTTPPLQPLDGRCARRRCAAARLQDGGRLLRALML